MLPVITEVLYALIAAVTASLMVLALVIIKKKEGSWKRGTGFRFFFVFSIGIAFGLAIAIIFFVPYSSVPSFGQPPEKMRLEEGNASISLLHSKIDLSSSFAHELLRGVVEKSHRKVAREVRVLCLVMTSPENFKARGVPVRDTWGTHCNLLVFVSHQEDNELPVEKLEVQPGEGQWAKTVAALQYIYLRYKLDFDWIVKADDDTFVLVESVRYMVQPYSPFSAVYFDCRPNVTPEDNRRLSNGIVMSKQSLKELISSGFDLANADCKGKDDPGPEDVNLYECLKAVGANPGDSLDEMGSSRSFAYDVDFNAEQKQGNKDWWFWNYVYWPMYKGQEVSIKPLFFHYVQPISMYTLEYLIYNVQPVEILREDTVSTPAQVELSPVDREKPW